MDLVLVYCKYINVMSGTNEVGQAQILFFKRKGETYPDLIFVNFNLSSMNYFEILLDELSKNVLSDLYNVNNKIKDYIFDPKNKITVYPHYTTPHDIIFAGNFTDDPAENSKIQTKIKGFKPFEKAAPAYFKDVSVSLNTSSPLPHTCCDPNNGDPNEILKKGFPSSLILSSDNYQLVSPLNNLAININSKNPISDHLPITGIFARNYGSGMLPLGSAPPIVPSVPTIPSGLVRSPPSPVGSTPASATGPPKPKIVRNPDEVGTPIPELKPRIKENPKPATIDDLADLIYVRHSYI
jgi:hypothetical protein